jgi:hypothetical protein
METSQERADEFARRLGGEVAKALGGFIEGAKPTNQVERAQAGKAGKRDTERARDEARLGDEAPKNARRGEAGPAPGGSTAKGRDEASLTSVPSQGKVRGGRGAGRQPLDQNLRFKKGGKR